MTVECHLRLEVMLFVNFFADTILTWWFGPIKLSRMDMNSLLAVN